MNSFEYYNESDSLYRTFNIREMIIEREIAQLNDMIESEYFSESVEDLKEKLINLGNSILSYTSVLKKYIGEKLLPYFEKAKSVYKTVLDKTEVKGDWNIFHKAVCKVLHTLLKKIADYGHEIATAKGVYNKLKPVVIAASLPIPMPGSTEGIIIGFKFVETVIKLGKTLKSEGIEAVINELKSSIEKVKEIDQESASVGTKLLNKLYRVLEISKNQLGKAYSTLEGIIK